VDSLLDFAEGSLLGEVLFKVDPVWFKKNRPQSMADNWIVKFNNLKRIYKLVEHYFEEILGLVLKDEQPNLTFICRDDNEEELLMFVNMIICIAVQCESNHMFIEKTQTLSEEDQQRLMEMIEQTMALF
ncbi:hypothetical protein EDD86DRAFT_181974, partial [Gorgonomyces haynaldii]